MKLSLNQSVASAYRSKSQIARVMTETWVADNMFCPRCGHLRIKLFESNRPVADFYCPNCSAEYELKSKNGTIQQKVVDGAYETMINRIMSDDNPDFFFMNYSAKLSKVIDFVIVPKHFFVPGIIEKRKALSDNARRAGWVGCNILLGKIPYQGRIPVVKNGIAQDSASVIEKMNKAKKLEDSDIESRGWIFDILNCVNQVESMEFSLSEVYAFESVLSQMHPQNHNVKAKIRQQLQFLRDKNIIEFLGNGMYRKL